MGELRAYRCWLVWDGEERARTEYAETAGKARYACLLDLRDVLPDLAFSDIRCRSLGPAAGRRCPDLDRLAESYGLPPLPLGTPAEFGGRPCSVAGYRDGYIVLRDEETGETFADHILSGKRYFLADGTVIDGEDAARAYDARWAAVV